MKSGMGYPQGLSGNQIDLFSRICTITDIYDAITSNRVYSKANTPEKAKKYLADNSSTLIDPKVKDAFFSCLNVQPSEKDILKVNSPHKVNEFLIDNASVLVDPDIINIFSSSINIYPNGYRHIALNHTDELINELYSYLCHIYRLPFRKSKDFDALVNSRLSLFASIANLNENSLSIILEHFSEHRKEIKEKLFQKINSTLSLPDSELESTHCQKPVFKFGNIVKIEEHNKDLEDRAFFIKTQITETGIFAEVMPINKEPSKLIRICKLRKLNPEY